MPRYLPTLPDTLKNTDTDRANTSVSADNSKPAQHYVTYLINGVTTTIIIVMKGFMTSFVWATLKLRLHGRQIAYK